MGSLAVHVPAGGVTDAGVVERMLDAAPHRGSERHTVRAGAVVLGVSGDAARRDAHVASGPGGTAAIAGRLDNAAELAQELRRAGRDPGGDPAAVLLAAFALWGPEAAARLRGAFAGAVTDGATTHVVRDQLGMRPLYVRENGHGVLAASEVKQVIAGAGLDRRADPDALADTFYGRVGDRQTHVRGVERIPPATLATVDGAAGLRLRRYWDPSSLLETSSLGVDEACERLVELLEQAARRMVTGEDAISLSGGVDSPTVAAFAAPAHREVAGRELHAVSAVYPGFPAVDERPWIEATAQQLGLPLHSYVPEARPLDDVRRWVDLLDGPVDTVSIPEAAESYRQARGVGARSVLTGELEEYVFEMYQHLLGHLLLHGRWASLAAWAGALRGRGRSWRSLAAQVAPSVAPAFVVRRRRAWRRRDVRPGPPWIDPRMRPAGASPVPARRRWLDKQLAPFNGPPTTLEADEICAAACGVDVRRPFADVDLWEFALSLRAEVKAPPPGTKALVRRAARGRVPDVVLDRRDKTYFDDHGRASVDYPALRSLLVDPAFRVEGVDYGLLARRLAAEDMGLLEAMWATDLAQVHAFAEVAG